MNPLGVHLTCTCPGISHNLVVRTIGLIFSRTDPPGSIFLVQILTKFDGRYFWGQFKVDFTHNHSVAVPKIIMDIGGFVWKRGCFKRVHALLSSSSQRLSCIIPFLFHSPKSTVSTCFCFCFFSSGFIHSWNLGSGFDNIILIHPKIFIFKRTLRRRNNM